MDAGFLAGTALLFGWALELVQYRKTLPENLPNHPARKRLLEILRQHPGTNISRLCEALGYKWGVLKHHLQLLERAALVRGLTVGREHYYFPREEAPEHLRQIAILRRGRVQELVRAVVRQPGSIQRQLTQELGLSRKVVRQSVDLLKGAGLIQEVAESKTRRYFPTETLRDVLTNTLQDPVRPPAATRGLTTDEGPPSQENPPG